MEGVNTVLAGLFSHWLGIHSRALWRSIVKKKDDLLLICSSIRTQRCAREESPACHASVICDSQASNVSCVMNVIHTLAEALVERTRGMGLVITPQLLEFDHCCGQAYGDRGLERWVDRSAELAEAFEQRIVNSKGAFQLVLPRLPFNVCFWWVPQQLRPYKPDEASVADRALLSKVI